MPYTDKTLSCVDCGAEFVFSAEDQEYHAQRGFTNEPRRCRSCRALRRAQRNGEDVIRLLWTLVLPLVNALKRATRAGCPRERSCRRLRLPGVAGGGLS